jgi:hypothetical protein
MTEQKKSLSDVAAGFEEFIKPEELESVLHAMMTLHKDSGWDGISLIYLNHELDTLDINIKRKPKKQKTV